MELSFICKTFVMFTILVTSSRTLAGNQPTSVSEDVSAVGPKIPIYLAGFFSLNAGLDLSSLVPAVDMALEHINERPDILADYELKMEWKDTQVCLRKKKYSSWFFIYTMCLATKLSEMLTIWSNKKNSHSDSISLYFWRLFYHEIMTAAFLVGMKFFGWAKIFIFFGNEWAYSLLIETPALRPLPGIRGYHCSLPITWIPISGIGNRCFSFNKNTLIPAGFLGKYSRDKHYVRPSFTVPQLS